MASPRTLLCIGGHDPTGGAGLQADIETLSAHGVRACTLVTCLTAQDTRDVQGIWPAAPDAFRRQRDVLLADIRPDAVKIGLLGSAEIAIAALELIAALDVPVVLDPVLGAGGGATLAGHRLVEQLRTDLMPHVSLVTPNRAELSALAGVDEQSEAAAALLSLGAGAVLVTGADAATASGDAIVTNTLYVAARPPRSWNWPRLPGVYHGSGCTLASACAAGLARGEPLEPVIEQAQRFTWRALERSEQVGADQQLPTRTR